MVHGEDSVELGERVLCMGMGVRGAEKLHRGIIGETIGQLSNWTRAVHALIGNEKMVIGSCRYATLYIIL